MEAFDIVFDDEVEAGGVRWEKKFYAVGAKKGVCVRNNVGKVPKEVKTLEDFIADVTKMVPAYGSEAALFLCDMGNGLMPLTSRRMFEDTEAEYDANKYELGYSVRRERSRKRGAKWSCLAMFI